MMKRSGAHTGVAWYLGTIQYGVCLFAGGALWFLVAQLTGFFGDSLAIQVAACLALLALIAAESWWSHMPGSGNEVLDFSIDVATSVAIAAFGMAIVAAVLAWLPK